MHCPDVFILGKANVIRTELGPTQHTISTNFSLWIKRAKWHTIHNPHQPWYPPPLLHLLSTFSSGVMYKEGIDKWTTKQTPMDFCLSYMSAIHRHFLCTCKVHNRVYKNHAKFVHSFALHCMVGCCLSVGPHWIISSTHYQCTMKDEW